eukprot:Pgem_evm1s9510
MGPHQRREKTYQKIGLGGTFFGSKLGLLKFSEIYYKIFSKFAEKKRFLGDDQLILTHAARYCDFCKIILPRPSNDWFYIPQSFNSKEE